MNITFLLLATILALGMVSLALMVNQKLVYLMIGLWALTIIFTTGSFLALLGTPKPTINEFRKVEVAQVLWAKVVVNEKILLILTWKGLPEPLYYSMPWSKELEKQLSQAQSKSTARNTPIMIRNPFNFKSSKPSEGEGQPGNGKGKGKGSGSQSGSGDNDENFYVAPPVPLPLKDGNNLTEEST